MKKEKTNILERAVNWICSSLDFFKRIEYESWILEAEHEYEQSTKLPTRTNAI